MVVTSGAPILPRNMRKLRHCRQTRFVGGIFLLVAAQPIDLSVETRLDAEVKSWFAFACKNVMNWHCCAMR